MRLEPRNTAILLVVFLGLALVVFLVLPEEEVGSGGERLFEFVSDEVVRLVVAGPEGEVRVVREEEGWRMELPFDAKADGLRLTRVLDGLSLISSDREIPPEAVDLTAFGLEDPTTVTATMGDGSEVVLLVGSSTPRESEYYVQVRGEETVHLIRAFPVEELLELLAQPPEIPTPTPTWTPAPTLVPTKTPTLTPVPTPTLAEGTMDEVPTPSN
ncbi:MAG: DUF4340 domain-containing protein [Anaerolineae bacterium]